MKICYVLENFFPKVGGVETLFFNLAKEAVKGGNQVRVLTSMMSSDIPKEKIDGIEIFRYRWFSAAGHSLPKTKDIIKHIAWADVVHTTTYSAAPAAQKISKKLNKPIVISVHEVLGTRWFHAVNPVFAIMFYFYERFVVGRKYTSYHTISEASARDMVKAHIPNEKIRMVQPGLDIDVTKARKTINEILSIENDKKCFLFFGRWGKTKGLPVLLKAIKQIEAKLPPNIVFAVIVDEPKIVSEVAQKMTINKDKVKIVKSLPRKDLLDCVKTAYAVIVPSITEGFGFTTAESCALGTPVIGSTAGSIPEVISGKYLLFENRNSQDLGRKIIQSLKGDFLSKPIKYFRWEDSAKKTLEIYSSLVRKRIGIVCDPMDLNFKGITTYTNNLVEKIAELTKGYDLFLIHLKNNPLIQRICKENTNVKDVIIPVMKFPFSYEFRKIISIPRKIRELDLDLIHETANAGGNMFFKTKARQVTTIHDITPITHPEWHTFQNWLRNKLTIKYTLHSSAAIITDSMAVKNELISRYNMDKNNITVIPLASNDRLKSVKPKKPVLDIRPREFVLSVSTVEPRKNYDLLAQAFSEIKTNKKLVIAGRWGWRSEQLKDKYEKGAFNNVIFTGEISDRELKWLYSNSLAFCMASLDEGFGLPIIEAATFGNKILCSDIPVFKEITGEKAAYFNPLKKDDIKLKLSNMLNSTDLLDAKAITKKYSWEKCATETLSIYKKHL